LSDQARTIEPMDLLDSVTALFLVASMGGLTVPAPASVPATCADVVVVGVAGSGQTPGTGPQVGSLAAAIAEGMGRAGRTIEVAAVDYPAVDLAASFGLALFDGRYEESVAVGAERLSLLIGELGRCAGTRLVIVGYSQGAEVVKRALGSVVPEAPIEVVVLIADPTRDPAQAGVVRVAGAPDDREGSLGALAVPARWARQTIDVCTVGDVVCGSRSFRIGAHGFGYDEPVRAAAGIAIRRLVRDPVAWDRY